METKKYGIALLPNKQTEEAAIALSEDFLPFADDRPLRLAKTSSIPHITLFMIMLDEPALERVVESVQRLLDETIVPRNGKEPFRRGHRPIFGRFDRLRRMGRVLYWAQSARSNPILRKLHLDIVDACSPLRQGNIPPLGTLKGEALRRWEETGYPLVRERFYPHITLQRLSDSHLEMSIPHQRPWRWTSRKLVITEMDERGAIVSSDHAMVFHLR